MEELKLESKTFRTDPVLLIRCILQYAESLPEPGNKALAGDFADPPAGEGLSSAGKATAGKVLLEKKAEEKAFPEKISAVPLTGLSAFFARRAALGIRNREKSRLHRGRLYGMMRSLVLQMGKNLHRQGRISEPSDVFWLYCREVEEAEKDPALDLAEIIAGRKTEYSGYAALPPYSRLMFSGKIINKHSRQNRTVCHGQADGDYTGTACSPGIAEGEVLLVKNPSPALDTKEKILVTKMTDPGWVFLIAPAKAIVSEKGSLLSHTAIISRELKKPAVVGIEHITEYLKTGDCIRVDGDRGIVTLLSRAELQEETGQS